MQALYAQQLNQQNQFFQHIHFFGTTGFVDLIVERKELASKIGTLLSILLKKNSDISAEKNETSEDSQSLTRAAS